MGLSLDAEFATLVAPLLPVFASMPKPAVHDVQARRMAMAAFTQQTAPIPDGVEREILSVAAEDGHPVPVWRIARKAGAGPAEKSVGPALLYMHGGGLIALDVEAFAEKLYALVLASGVTIYAVDYRLAPEHPYPTPLHDCWAALQYLRDNAAALGIDAARIGVMGDSAGGNLAAGVTLLARDRKMTPPIASQFLLYPMLDDRNKETVAPGLVTLWDEGDNATGWTAYLGDKVGGEDVPVDAAPGRLMDATGLPPLFVYVGQLDIFAKEDVRYASLFIEAGIQTELHVVPGLPHGFDGLARDHPAVKSLFGHQLNYLTTL